MTEGRAVVANIDCDDGGGDDGVDAGIDTGDDAGFDADFNSSIFLSANFCKSRFREFTSCTSSFSTREFVIGVGAVDC